MCLLHWYKAVVMHTWHRQCASLLSSLTPVTSQIHHRMQAALNGMEKRWKSKHAATERLFEASMDSARRSAAVPLAAEVRRLEGLLEKAQRASSGADMAYTNTALGRPRHTAFFLDEVILTASVLTVYCDLGSGLCACGTRDPSRVRFWIRAQMEQAYRLR